jgi:thiol-disulfide isomerase/thioredoxin
MPQTLLRTLKANAGLIFLFVVLASSLSLNVALGRELQRRPPTTAARMAGLQADTVMPPISAQDRSGNPVQITFQGDRPTVLYVLSPLCGWCKRNEPNIQALASAGAGKYRFVGLSTNGDLQQLNELLKANPLPFEVYFMDSVELIEKLDLGVTPQTAIVAADGRIERTWQGAYDESISKEVESLFGVALPGLRPPSRQAAPPAR